MKTSGFPSPAADYFEPGLDVHQWLQLHKEATFYMRISTNAFAQEGIFEGDVLVIDRSLLPKENDLVVVVQDQQFVLRKYPYSETLELWGTVSGLVRKYRK